MSILKFKSKYKEKQHEDIFKIYHKIGDTPKCYCGDNLKFISLTKGYSCYCSSDCRQKKEKYNIENITRLVKEIGLMFSPYEMRQIKYHLGWTSEDLYLLKHPESNVCCVCGGKTNLVNMQVGFLKTCSYKCGNSLPKRKLTPEEKKIACDKRKATNKEKYGVEYIFQLIDNSGENNNMKNPETVKKQHKTMEERYGDAHALNITKFKEKRESSNLIRFGVKQNLSLHEFREDSMIKKYGVPYTLQSPELLEKFKMSRINNLTLREDEIGIDGYVYILLFDELELVKIGLSGEYNRRLKSLTRDFGSQKAIWVIKTNSCRELELFLHGIFSEHRVILSEGNGKTEFFKKDIINILDSIELPTHLSYEFLIGKD